ncbi:MAG: hypothetical protein LBR92_02465 [Puniceicoccales bacterium]|jgi:hypothetical protein|nr:hypothetical protein [Puniceicoccales bacterium]
MEKEVAKIILGAKICLLGIIGMVFMPVESMAAGAKAKKPANQPKGVQAPLLMLTPVILKNAYDGMDKDAFAKFIRDPNHTIPGPSTVADTIVAIVKERFNVDLKADGNMTTNPWQRTDSTTIGYGKLFSSLYKVIKKQLKTQPAMAGEEAEKFQVLLDCLEAQYKKRGIQRGVEGLNAKAKIKQLALPSPPPPPPTVAASPAPPVRPIAASPVRSRPAVAASLEYESIVFLVAADLGRTLYQATNTPWKEIWDPLSTNPLRITIDKKEQSLASILHDFHELDPDGKCIGMQKVPNDKLCEIGLGSDSKWFGFGLGSKSQDDLRHDFQKKFFFLAANLEFFLVDGDEKLQKMENAIHLAVDCLKIIGDSKGGPQKDAFPNDMWESFLSCIQERLQVVLDKKGNVRKAYAKAVKGKKDVMKKLDDQPLTPHNVYSFIQYLLDMFIHVLSPNGKDLNGACEDYFTRGQGLLLVRDYAIRGGERLMESITSMVISCKKMFQEFFLHIGDPGKKEFSYLCCWLQEVMGYARLFFHRELFKDSLSSSTDLFPKGLGFSYVDDVAKTIYEENFKNLVAWFCKKESTIFCIEAARKLAITLHLPKIRVKDPISESIIDKFFIDQVFHYKDRGKCIDVDPDIALKAKAMVHTLIELLGYSLSLENLLKTTNFFRLFSKLLVYVHFFSTIPDTIADIIMNRRSSGPIVNQLMDLEEWLGLTCSTMGFDKGPIDPMVPKMPELIAKTNKKGHIFEESLTFAKEILEETLNLLLTKSNIDVALLSEEEKRNEIFHIECDLITYKTIMSYWEIIKESIKLLWRLAASRLELERAINFNRSIDICNDWRSIVRQCLCEIIWFAQEKRLLLIKIFEEHRANILDKQIEYWIKGGKVRLDGQDFKDNPGPNDKKMKKSFEDLKKSLDDAMKGEKTFEEIRDAMRKILEKVSRDPQMQGARNIDPSDTPPGVWVSLPELIQMMQTMADMQDEVTKIAGKLPKLIQTVGVGRRPHEFATKQMIFIPLRSDYNDIL